MREYAMEKRLSGGACADGNTVEEHEGKFFIFQARGRGAQRGQAVLLYLCDKRLPSAAGGAVRRTGRLSCDGVGGRTAGYYLPNALLREYIAYVVMNKSGI